MRLLPAIAVTVSLLTPSMAFAACDEAEVEKLVQEMQDVSMNWATKSQDADAIMKKAEEVEKLTKAAQDSADPEAACQLMRDIITLYQ